MVIEEVILVMVIVGFFVVDDESDVVNTTGVVELVLVVVVDMGNVEMSDIPCFPPLKMLMLNIPHRSPVANKTTQRTTLK